jgi:hypothetical protein
LTSGIWRVINSMELGEREDIAMVRRELHSCVLWRGLKSCVITFALIISFAGMVGCTKSRSPAPLTQILSTKLISIPDVRAWGDEHSDLFQDDLIKSMQSERKGDFPLNADGSTSYHALALSGGGENGAFGAGVLCGWTQKGTRPKFKLVTGISTGSLIAPFAFLGPEYDQQLKEAYTTIGMKDIVKKRNIVSLLWSESFEDTSPFKKLIARVMDEDKLKKIADEHAKGRRLYIGTTDMDAGRIIIWNMGAIASSGHPDALEVFRKVMLASSSIPGAFPPVYFDVEVDGKKYDEMHADGGTITQVFFYGFMLDLAEARKEVFGANAPPPGGSLYIIRNGKINASPKQVKRKLTSIISRALSILTKSQSGGDLYRIHAITESDGIGFNYIEIPTDYVPISEKTFDQAEMNSLFKLGFSMAKSGKDWHKKPPGLEIIESK